MQKIIEYKMVILFKFHLKIVKAIYLSVKNKFFLYK